MSEVTSLHIETDEDTYRSGDKITVRVRDEDGVPVEGVTVQAATDTAARTDATGKATIVVEQTGVIELTARKADTEDVTYLPDSRAVSIDTP